VYSYYQWFYRGGGPNNGLDAGVFAFNNHDGRALDWVSFRVVFCYYFKINRMKKR